MEHRSDPRFMSYKGDGALLVTWANVPHDIAQRGVEAYLISIYNPVENTQRPTAHPMPVNLPS